MAYLLILDLPQKVRVSAFPSSVVTSEVNVSLQCTTQGVSDSLILME